MSRKDYVALASALAAALAESEGSGCVQIVRVTDHIADVLAADNPRFDRERFLAAVSR